MEGCKQIFLQWWCGTRRFLGCTQIFSTKMGWCTQIFLQWWCGAHKLLLERWCGARRFFLQRWWGAHRFFYKAGAAHRFFSQRWCGALRYIYYHLFLDQTFTSTKQPNLTILKTMPGTKTSGSTLFTMYPTSNFCTFTIVKKLFVLTLTHPVW